MAGVDKGRRDKAETPEKEAGDGSWWLRHLFFASWGHRPVLSVFICPLECSVF